jgi:hypothetical protein
MSGHPDGARHAELDHAVQGTGVDPHVGALRIEASRPQATIEDALLAGVGFAPPHSCGRTRSQAPT